MEDSQIVELFWKRDQAAVQEAEARYGSYCFAVAEHILEDPQDAEECVSETWWRAWSSIPPTRPGNLKLFLARITRNLSLDRWKAKRAEKRGGGELALILDELDECVPASETVEEALSGKELGACINRFVRSLPEREGNLFLRRYFFSEPVEEIASRFGLTAHHASVLLSRTRQKLKAFLEKEGYSV